MFTNLAVVRARPLLLPDGKTTGGLQVFSTCPRSLTATKDYVRQVADVARWSESIGCAGILVCTDNTPVDPWLVSQIVIQNTESLCPAVAVQPADMHPYTVAKMVSSLALLHGRRVYLNMVAGESPSELAALSDSIPYGNRYRRLVEYTEIVQRLIDGDAVTFEGAFYTAHGPRMAPELRPGILVSEFSECGREAALQLGAIAIESSGSRQRSEAPAKSGACGLRIGIVARPSGPDAWTVAFERFPKDRTAKLTLKGGPGSGNESPADRDTYWLHPFESYQTNCPYLVGSYASVAEGLARYIGRGYRTFILDIPPVQEEFAHIGRVFQIAWRRACL